MSNVRVKSEEFELKKPPNKPPNLRAAVCSVVTLALTPLRALAGLTEAKLLALHRARITFKEPALLERSAAIGFLMDERPRELLLPEPRHHHRRRGR
jgi:hypothetical protein